MIHRSTFFLSGSKINDVIRSRISFTSIPHIRRYRTSFLFLSASKHDNTNSRPDPMTRRPTKVCDPYGQGGKPLQKIDAKGLLSTLDEGWVLADANEGEKKVPSSLYKEFYHPDFIHGSKFGSIVAAVAHNNNHYPEISLKRKLMKKEKAWSVVTKVCCFTPTLGGLSYNDFHLAMLVDVEAERPENKKLFVSEDARLRKHI